MAVDDTELPRLMNILERGQQNGIRCDLIGPERLKELETADIVTRTVTPNTPVRIEYGLTDRGRDLGGVMGELAAWAERWAAV